MKLRLAACLLAATLISLAGACSPVPSWDPPPPQPTDKSLERSLWEAAQGCDPRSLISVLRAGAKIDTPKGPEGTTALMEAVRSFGPSCPKESVVVLLTSHAKVDLQDKYGRTALHHLVMTECTEPYLDVLRLLLKWGANPELKDKQGQAPLTMAAERGCNPMVKILADAVAMRRQPQAAPQATTPAMRTDQMPASKP
ncbi:MAG: ankyrin repeat domain-containing protein [Pseudomonadota bacterium]